MSYHQRTYTEEPLRNSQKVNSTLQLTQNSTSPVPHTSRASRKPTTTTHLLFIPGIPGILGKTLFILGKTLFILGKTKNQLVNLSMTPTPNQLMSRLAMPSMFRRTSPKRTTRLPLRIAWGWTPTSTPSTWNPMGTGSSRSST